MMDEPRRGKSTGLVTISRACLVMLVLLLMQKSPFTDMMESDLVPNNQPTSVQWSPGNASMAMSVIHSHTDGRGLGVETSTIINPENRFTNHPPKCTDDQLGIVNKQLSPRRCVNSRTQPYRQRCSFTQATKCPDPIWLDEFHRNKSGISFLSYFIGCNKAIDAVSALRMGSKDPMHDLVKWQQHLQNGGSTFDMPSCDQFKKVQAEISSSQTVINDAQVHCVEPITNTFAELTRTKQELGWGDELVLVQGAFSSQLGNLSVPVFQKVGTENIGIDIMMKECSNPAVSQAGRCMDVPIMTLDDYHWRHGHGTVHYLSIDVEGFDPLVLQGGMKTLKEHVQYVEFEYNWKGPWNDTSLSSVVASLKDIGFTCYWPGTNGEIWRMTDCWLDHYDIKFWSNVACVNQNDADAAPMARRMEELFLETLQKENVGYI
jgi:FkbM family methyltransferase